MLNCRTSSLGAPSAWSNGWPCAPRAARLHALLAPTVRLPPGRGRSTAVSARGVNAPGTEPPMPVFAHCAGGAYGSTPEPRCSTVGNCTVTRVCRTHVRCSRPDVRKRCARPDRSIGLRMIGQCARRPHRAHGRGTSHFRGSGSEVVAAWAAGSPVPAGRPRRGRYKIRVTSLPAHTRRRLATATGASSPSSWARRRSRQVWAPRQSGPITPPANESCARTRTRGGQACRGRRARGEVTGAERVLPGRSSHGKEERQQRGLP